MRMDAGGPQRVVIAGSPEECDRVKNLVAQTGITPGFTGFVSTSQEANGNNVLGRFDQLSEIVKIYSIDEIIFCAKDISAQEIIDRMAQLGDSRKVSYKIAPPESLSIIGSNSIDTAGDLYVIDINSVSKPVNRRNKRVVDFTVAFGFLLLFPLLMWTQKNPFGFVGNIFRVLFGNRSWVGYAPGKNHDMNLPKIRTGVLNPLVALPLQQHTEDIRVRLNILYAKDYKISNDLRILRKGFRSLGN
jgi:hypothetical protein